MAPEPKGPTTITLKEPIMQGTREITQLTMQRPTLKHMRGLKAGEMPTLGQIGDMLSELCNEPPSVIGELGMEDTMTLAGLLADFFPSFQPTGKTQ